MVTPQGRPATVRKIDVLRSLLAITLLLLPWGVALAEEKDDGIATFVLENDLFAGRDDEYTNGFQISYLSGPDVVPKWVRDGAAMLPFLPFGSSVRGSVAIGQAMYTPSDIQLDDPPRDDRPYAGWAYVAVGLIAENGSELDQLQLQVGVIGPASLAEPTQKFVHQIINSPEPRGWSHQLHNEPGIVLTYLHSNRAYASGELLGFAVDATPHFGGALGNVFTYANTGVTLRMGYNLPDDYGPPRMRPGLPGNGFFRSQDDGLGWYLFAGFDGRLVLRNIFLDGNTFGDSRNVDRNWAVADAQVGIAFTYGDYRLAYTHVFRTKEFGDDKGADAFGAVSLTMKF